MMIRLVNESGIGQEDNILWLSSDYLAIGVHSVKSLFVITNEETLHIKLNSIWKLIDSSTISSNFKDYLKNEIHLTKYKKLDSGENIFEVPVCLISPEEGEFIENIIINNQSFKIAQSFVGIDERLQILVSNFGLELPLDITKALGPGDPFNGDVGLYNRKLRELLLNWFEIGVNKGNYKSLKNSLDWFEWDSKLELFQLYKNHKYKEFFSKTPGCSKKLTTNFGISYPYEDPSKLIYKIILLGLFFERYFTPIHIDIIRYSLEDFNENELSINTYTSLPIQTMTYFGKTISIFYKRENYIEPFIEEFLDSKGLYKEHYFPGLCSATNKEPLDRASNDTYLSSTSLYRGPGCTVPVRVKLNYKTHKFELLGPGNESRTEYFDDPIDELKFNIFITKEGIHTYCLIVDNIIKQCFDVEVKFNINITFKTKYLKLKENHSTNPFNNTLDIKKPYVFSNSACGLYESYFPKDHLTNLYIFNDTSKRSTLDRFGWTSLQTNNKGQAVLKFIPKDNNLDVSTIGIKYTQQKVFIPELYNVFEEKQDNSIVLLEASIGDEMYVDTVWNHIYDDVVWKVKDIYGSEVLTRKGVGVLILTSNYIQEMKGWYDVEFKGFGKKVLNYKIYI